MRKQLSLLAGGLACLATACASYEPVLLSSSFAPFGGTTWEHTPRGNPPPVCRVGLGEFVDSRTDKETMGHIAGRFVRLDDAVGWVRSGFATLSKDKRIAVVDADDVGDGMMLHVTLLKSYMGAQATAKTANVVVRVRYEQGGAQVSEKMLRGDYTDVNWGSGDGEARDSLNAALQEVIAATHKDVVALCVNKKAAVTAPPASAR
jgi:hypothetical protein